MRIPQCTLVILLVMISGAAPSPWSLLMQQIRGIFQKGDIQAEKWFVTIPPPCPEPNASNLTLHGQINDQPIEKLVLKAPRFNATTRYAIAIVVISAEYEKEERREIRRLWASSNESAMQKTGQSLVVFLVGRSSRLDEEAATHGDLLQMDIPETYRNLVYKIEAGFRWINANVQFDFVAKADSDTVVHIDRLHDQLRRIEEEQKNDWIACHRISGSQPFRDTCSPWYVSLDEYPSSHFPDYCSGCGYVMRRQTIAKIVERMGNFQLFEIEDAFFTGHVALSIDGLRILDGIGTMQYTEYAECDDNGPAISFLNTHFQLNSTDKSEKNLTSAWERLKNPYCYNFWTRWFNS